MPTITSGCSCGEVLDETLPTLADALRRQREWSAEHSGEGHRPCCKSEAERVAKARARLWSRA